jgi:hypothetical protein
MKKQQNYQHLDPIESKRRKKPKMNPKLDPSRKNKKYFYNVENVNEQL